LQGRKACQRRKLKLLRGRIWDPQKHAALVQDSSRSFTEPLQAFPFFLFFQVFRATSSRVPFSSHALRLRQTASFLSHCTKSVRCVLGLLLSCYPTFTLSLPLWFSISIPLVLSYVSLSSRSSNSKGPASSSHLTSILRPQAHVQVRECRAGPGRPDLHTRAPSRPHVVNLYIRYINSAHGPPKWYF
jgi:hypothetical protein